VTAESAGRYEIRFQSAARRAISQRLPEAVAAAVLEFCDAALAENPHRVGKLLFGPLAGCHGARRGTYRIVYRIDESTRTVHVLDIDHRSQIYHQPSTELSGYVRPTKNYRGPLPRPQRGNGPR
jgi:mRNA-degrading endonuclease RelE of RelBE toxin-antitoxin system